MLPDHLQSKPLGSPHKQIARLAAGRSRALGQPRALLEQQGCRQS